MEMYGGIATGNSADWTISSDIGEIPGVSERLGEAMALQGFGPDEILDTQLAVEEIVTNVALHGYGSAQGEIRIAARFVPGEIEIRVSDTAPAFDPLSVPAPDTGGDIDDRQIGGLGIFLVRQVMDTIAYSRDGNQNVLTMIKRKAA